MSWCWDRWQKEVLEHRGNITLRTGRQVGKSEVVAEKAGRFAEENAGTVVLIIAASQRQSALLFEKVKGRFDLKSPEGESVYAEPPTLTRIILKNSSKILCLPAGKTGMFIRGFTVDMLIADEAAYIPEVVWNSVIPMIAVSKKTRGFGWLVLLSTPFGKGGFYYDSFTDRDFKSWHVSSEKCARIPRDLLAKEKKRMSKVEYGQEWLGEFCEEFNQMFKTSLIKKCMTFIEWKREEKILGSKFYLGVDVARYGGDENAFVICEMVGSCGNEKLKIVKCLTTERVSCLDTIKKVELLDSEWNFSKIMIDDAGVGGAVTDVLEDKLGRKVIGLNNASKRIEVQGEERKKGILKEDLYSNALVLMEQGNLELIADKDLLRSLKCITFDYGVEKTGKVKIGGVYSHLTEALVRACWCIKEKGLKIFLY